MLPLHFSGTGSFQVDMRQPKQISRPPAFDADTLIDSMMNVPLYLYVEEGTSNPDVCYLDKAHLDLLQKFHKRSVLSIGTVNSVHVYQRILTQMASRHSFVLHTVLRFTLLHDRYLYDPPGASPSEAEAFHGYHAAALFNQVLSIDSHTNEVKDALWATAAILGAGSFAAIEATSAEEAWPLKPPSISDLDWLRMSEGKNAVWRIASPLREDSAFRHVMDVDLRNEYRPSITQVEPAVHGFLLYCSHLNNQYAGLYEKAISIIERLMYMECSQKTAIWFLSFLGYMDPAFVQLLASKDAPALLLLCWWYAKLLQYNVW